MTKIKFILQCLDRNYPNLELVSENKGVRLGPSEPDAPYCRVEAYPDYKHAKVIIKNLGFTKCLLNFQHVIRKGEEMTGNAGDIIDLTFGTYLYRIREAKTTTVSPIVQQPKEKLIKPSTSLGQPVADVDDQLQAALGNESKMVIEDSSCMNLSEAVLLNIHSNQSIITQSHKTTINKKVIQLSDWDSIDGILGSLPVLVYGQQMDKMKSKVAAFDLDETLIKPKAGRWKPPEEGETMEPRSLWTFAYDSIPNTLRKYFKEHPDHKFLIVTNKANKFFEISQVIIHEVILELDIPVIVFAAKQGTEFLKPAPCIWEVYRKYYNEGVDPDWADSFFCGDCAGRYGDTSKGDRLFAVNVGAAFKTPEEFFLGQDQPSYTMPHFIPENFVLNTPNNDHISFPQQQQELIIMCGSAGSGKTWYVESTLLPKGYYHVYLCEKMGTPRERLHAASHALAKSLSVVVDRRNIDKDDRSAYLRMASQMAIPVKVRCFLMNVSPDHALHNLRFHEIKTGTRFPPGEMELCLKRHRALYEPPTVAEGFSEIVSVNFVPHAFLNKKELNLYSKFLIQN